MNGIPARWQQLLRVSLIIRSRGATQPAETNVLFSSNHTDNKYKFCHFVTHSQRIGFQGVLFACRIVHLESVVGKSKLYMNSGRSRVDLQAFQRGIHSSEKGYFTGNGVLISDI